MVNFVKIFQTKNLYVRKMLMLGHLCSKYKNVHPEIGNWCHNGLLRIVFYLRL